MWVNNILKTSPVNNGCRLSKVLQSVRFMRLCEVSVNLYFHAKCRIKNSLPSPHNKSSWAHASAFGLKYSILQIHQQNNAFTISRYTNGVLRILLNYLIEWHTSAINAAPHSKHWNICMYVRMYTSFLRTYFTANQNTRERITLVVCKVLYNCSYKLFFENTFLK